LISFGWDDWYKWIRDKATGLNRITYRTNCYLKGRARKSLLPSLIHKQFFL